MVLGEINVAVVGRVIYIINHKKKVPIQVGTVYEKPEEIAS